MYAVIMCHNVPRNKALGVSTGIDDLGSMQPHLVICWFITCVVVFLCIMKGIKSLGKVTSICSSLTLNLINMFSFHHIRADPG